MTLARWWTATPYTSRVLVVGASVLALWLSTPSWILRHRKEVWREEHRWFWNPPDLEIVDSLGRTTDYATAEIDLPRLCLGAAAIALLTGIAYLIARANPRPAKSAEDVDPVPAEREQAKEEPGVTANNSPLRHLQDSLNAELHVPKWVEFFSALICLGFVAAIVVAMVYGFIADFSK